MAAPSLVSQVATVFNTGATPKTSPSITTQAGDRIVCIAGSESNEGPFYDVPTGNSISFSAVTIAGDSGNFGEVGLSTGTDNVGGTFTISWYRSQNDYMYWGFVVYIFRGSTGFGTPAASTGSGGPSLALTTVQDGSAIPYLSTDWSAVDGTTRTWRTNNVTPTVGNGGDKAYYGDGNHYSLYSAYWSDAGSAGSKTLGLSSPTGQAWTAAAVEVKGSVDEAIRRAVVIAPGAAACMAAVW